MRARTSSLVTGALLVALIGAVVAVDRLVPPGEVGSTRGPAAAATASGGAWTCPVGDARAASELRVSTIGPGTPGEDPGHVELSVIGDGERERRRPSRVFPGTSALTRLEGADVAAVARWYDAPVGLYRHWRLRGDEGDEGTEALPPGRVSGPCKGTASDRWWIPGLVTAGGHEGRVRLANPYETDATVAIRLVTPEGPVEPTVLQNLSIQGHSTSEVVVNEHLPERDDVAVVVRVISGRVAAEGYQLVRQAIGDVDGASLLASAPGPDEVWTVPWVVDDGQQSWLWVLNPGDRPAPVELTLHGADGGIAPEGLTEVTVEPGQLRRIDLRGTFPDNLTTAAVTLRSDGVPVVASGLVRLEASEPADTGVAVQLGARPDAHWLLAGGPTEERGQQVRLVNPGSEPAVVDVSLWDGSEALRPGELRGVEVAPGALVRLDLTEHLGEVDGWSAQVVAREGEVVVGHLGQGGPDARELVAGPGLASGDWRAAGPALASRREVGLAQRTGGGTGDGPGLARD